MSRIPHPYDLWEGWQAGMYEPTTTPKDITAAVDLLAAPAALGEAMRKAIEQWPTEAENWLTRPGTKSRSWLGAAACMTAVGATMASTRAAWSQLTIQQQAAANEAADATYDTWTEGRHA